MAAPSQRGSTVSPTAKRFSVASGTAPTADETVPGNDTPATPPAPPEPAQPRTGAKLREATPPPDRARLDAAQERRWRREVGATGLALRAAEVDAAERRADWERLIADARKAGVKERILIAAAADADLDLPAPM